MKNNCFYYGVLNESGFRSLMCGSEFDSGKNIVLNCHSVFIKQQIFDSVKSELERKNILYTDFCTADGSGGVFCEKFRIIDSDFCNKNNESFLNFSVENLNDSDTKNVDAFLYEKEKQLQRAQRFISACKSINRDVIRLAEPYINKNKIDSFSSRLWQRTTNGMKGHVGTETKRFVTCLTADGSELNMEAFDICCEKMLVINDRIGACAERITDNIRSYALGAGYDVISCPCSIDETIIEHIIIPELSFGIFTSKYYHRADFENSRKIYAKRFMFPDVDDIKFRVDFSLKAYRKLMDEVFVSLEKVKQIDKNIDRIYSENFDCNEINKKLFSILFE